MPSVPSNSLFHSSVPRNAVPPDGPGLLRDLPDVRDWTLDAPPVREAFAKLRRRRGAKSTPPARVDLREFLPPPGSSAAPQMAVAAAVVTLARYFERRTLGRAVEPSIGFLYETSRRLAGLSGEGASLRTTLQALARFGCPPERFCPTDGILRGNAPDPFAYGFQREYLELRFARLDSPAAAGADVLRAVKGCVAAGFAVVCGAALAGGIDAKTGEIPYPSKLDAPAGAAPLVIVGYDDAHRIRSTKGALVVRTTFGPAWGDDGTGLLPYRYVEEHLACDFWTMWKPQWLASGELEAVASS